MPALTPEQRRQALRNRHSRTHSQKDAGGFGSGIIDLSKAKGIKIQKYEPEYKKGNLVDIIPFIITQEWYRDLRQPPDGSVMTNVNVGEPDYLLSIPVHKGIGPEKRAHLCPRAAFGNPCYACEERFAEMDKEESDDTKDEKKIQDLKHSWRCYYTVYNYDEPEKEFQLWPDVSWWNWEKPMQEDLEVGDGEAPVISDPVEGLSIEFTGKKKKLGKSEFMEGQSFSFVDREPYDDNVYDDAYPLDAMLIIPSYEDTMAAYLGTSRNKSEESNDSEESQPSRNRTRTRPDPSAGERPRARTRAKEQTPDDEPFENENPCPEGGTFGVDAGNLPVCTECDDEIFEECSKLQDKMKEDEKEPEPPKRNRARTRKPAETKPPRTRTRTRG